MNTRQHLIKAALDELERNGIERFSLRAVGANTGLSAMAVYRHFKNKEELLQVIGEHAFTAWKKRIESIKASAFENWFLKVTRAYVTFALDEPGNFDACFVLKTHVERIYPDDFRAGKSPVISLSMERIKKAQQLGEVKAGDALEMTLYIWAELHGLVMLHRSGRFSLSRKDFFSLCNRCCRQALSGLQPNSKGSKRS